jgi:ubiquinone/menaquinone biosynthesis C-methylase UbiE
MARSALNPPKTNPTPIADLFRGNFATELLVAAVHPFDLFRVVHSHPGMTLAKLAEHLGLAPRAGVVLFTALRAMDLLSVDANGIVVLPPISEEHLLPGGDFYMGDYLSLMADSPGVQNIVQRLKSNRPLGADQPDQSVAFIFREGMESAMDEEKKARHLTLALSGRAKNVAPHLAEKIDLTGVSTLLDVGGGTGIYSIACLQKYPALKAIIWDRPEVLKIAAEFGTEFGALDRMELIPGDMFRDPVPDNCEAILFSNILHDWDFPECHELLKRAHAALPPMGKVIIHDVFLNDDLSGPLNVALYSAALFNLTEGRAYSSLEYQEMLKQTGFIPASTVIPTLVHCGLLTGIKS